MITGNYVSSSTVIEKVFRDHPFVVDHLELSDALEWMGDLYGLMGVNSMLEDKMCQIEIEDYRGKLPSDLISIYGIRYDDGGGYIPMRYNGDVFGHKLHCSNSESLQCSADVTYKLNNHYIFPNFEEGIVEISYTAFPVDEDGFPMIPDDQAVIEAMAWYIAYKIAYQRWMVEEMKEHRFQFVRQQKDWYVGKAISRGKMPSVDQAETLKNMLLRLIPNINAHASGFKNIGEQERIWNHNTNNFNQADRTY